MGGIDGLEQGLDALPAQRRDRVHARERQEAQLAVELALDAFLFFAVQAVPLVDGHDHGSAGFQHEPGDVRVLLGDFGLRVEHEQHDVAGLDGLQGLDDGELFDRLEHLAALAQPGRVDQRVTAPIALEIDFDGVARRARHVERNHALFAHERIDERGLAYVGTAHDRQLDAVIVLAFFGRFFFDGRLGQILERQLDEINDAVAVRRRNGIRLAQAKFMEFGDGGTQAHAFGLVHRQQHALLAGLAQQLRDLVIVRIDARARIHQEHDDVRLGDGLAGLPGHFQQDAVLGHGLEAAGIDGDERNIAHPALAVMAIAGQAGIIGHQRGARSRQAVEKGRFPHIGAADQGNDRLERHGKRLCFISFSWRRS